MVTFVALAFLDLPFSLSYFELTSCPSTRTWSPLWSVSAMDSPRRLKATTRCHSVLTCHSSADEPVRVAGMARTSSGVLDTTLCEDHTDETDEVLFRCGLLWSQSARDRSAHRPRKGSSRCRC